jgi:ribose transport system ATP-binding protein
VAGETVGDAGRERPALQVSGVSVTFGTTRALDDVSIQVQPGSVHALIGGNGSGKSTLIKVLAGVQPADRGGTITLGDHVYPVEAMSPDASHAAGLRFVHQDLGLFDDMTVAENFALYARYPLGRGKRIAWRALHALVAEVLARFDIDATPRTLAGDLRPAGRTMVAIARALYDDEAAQRILVLDEPTASLPDHEVEVLFDSLRRRARQGQAILFVSHRLREVLSLASRLTVLRDGRSVAACDVASTTEQQVIELIAGRAVDKLYPVPASVTESEPSVVVRNLSAGPVSDVSLSVRPGEILGIAGLLGSGRTSLLRALFGDLPARAGTVMVGGRAGPFRSPKQAMAAGVGYVPEDRRGDAAFLDHSVQENLSAASAARYFRRLWMRQGMERRENRRLVDQFLIKTASITNPLDWLSGGNQQKVILARWMQRQPKLLLLDEPTQGVDVVARADIYRLIRRTAADGAAVLMVSSDLEELAHICDRAIVLARGSLVCEVGGDELNPERLYHLIQPRAVKP